MPLYDYACAEHGGFGAMRPMAERNAAQPCPRCAAPSARVLSAAPMFGLLGSQERQAHAANERSRHEPANLAAYRARHGAGCGCCAPGGKKRTATRPDGMKSMAGRRPWQISH